MGQGPIALAIGAGEGCLDIFSLVYLFSFLSPSLGDGPILTEALSQRAVKPQTSNQHQNFETVCLFFVSRERLWGVGGSDSFGLQDRFLLRVGS